jgi:membrane protein
MTFFQCLVRTITEFRRNQGFLLAGSVAYYSLLSMIPTLALLIIVLSSFLPEERLVEVLNHALEVFVPGQSASIVIEIQTFLGHWEMISLVGVGVLIFFSSLVFRVLEKAISVIFYHRVIVKKRHFLVSAIMPYMYISCLGVGLLALTFLSSLLQTIEHQNLEFLGYEWALNDTVSGLLYGLSVLAVIGLFSSIYLVMPIGKVSVRHALTGGVVAGLLWEVTRHVLLWYYASLSFVGVIYGSLATTVFALLSMDIAAMYVLLGAQVIALYEREGDETGLDRCAENLPQISGLET